MSIRGWKWTGKKTTRTLNTPEIIIKTEKQVRDKIVKLILLRFRHSRLWNNLFFYFFSPLLFDSSFFSFSLFNFELHAFFFLLLFFNVSFCLSVLVHSNQFVTWNEYLYFLCVSFFTYLFVILFFLLAYFFQHYVLVAVLMSVRWWVLCIFQ